MDDEEEEGVMGLLFAANTSDEDFVPPSGVGEGEGKSRAIAMDGVVDSPNVGASSSTTIQRKRRRNPFPDETEPEYRAKHDDDIDDKSHEADPLARAISAPTPILLDARPKKLPADDDNDIVVVAVDTDVLPPLRVPVAQAQNALYGDRSLGWRVMSQTVLRWLNRETVRPCIPSPQTHSLTD